MTLPVRIIYKSKKNSSGWVKGNEIVLSISSRLTAHDRAAHIATLTRRLQAAAERQRKRPPLALPRGHVRTDTELAALAKRLNLQHYGYDFARIRFWRQRSRWGSCLLHKREIHISHRLKDAPLILLEYVVIHELCHLKEPNHGTRFWRLVAKACPDYLERRRLLATFGEVGLQGSGLAVASD